MQRFRRLIALVLLALWLPATLHCGLETLGVIPKTSCAKLADHTSAGTSHCEGDGCKIVEDGLYRSSTLLKVAATPESLCACLLYLHTLEPDSATALVFSPAPYVEPFELIRTWQFVQRAALLPGAPSLA